MRSLVNPKPAVGKPASWRGCFHLRGDRALVERRGGTVGLVEAARPVLWLVLLAGLTSCASVSVVSVSENRALRPSGSPPVIGVGPIYDIDSVTKENGGTLYLDGETGHIHSGKKGAPMTESMVSEQISRSIMENWEKVARVVDPRDPESLEGGSLLVTGQSWQEENGSVPLRTLLGLGLGRSRLEAVFHVFNMEKSSRTPWLKIRTSGGSGREPGILLSLAPSPYLPLNILGWSGAGLALISHGSKGVGQDARRTGKMVSLCIAEHLGGAGSPRLPVAKTVGHFVSPDGSTRIKIPMSAPQSTGMDASKTLFIGD